MSKSQFPRVKHLPVERFCEPAAVDFVTQHRMTQMMQMNPDLVGSAAV
jgi:phage replication-related protein YjqB (UPF0714/DUF867 family)